jgi:hypothetical protein
MEMTQGNSLRIMLDKQKYYFFSYKIRRGEWKRSCLRGEVRNRGRGR